uniref:Repetitive proline-rich cell wall protein 2-like n=1 Tax=Syphacia muris TaxID=451379 RepID=A0A0N5AJ22_9BILA
MPEVKDCTLFLLRVAEKLHRVAGHLVSRHYHFISSVQVFARSQRPDFLPYRQDFTDDVPAVVRPDCAEGIERVVSPPIKQVIAAPPARVIVSRPRVVVRPARVIVPPVVRVHQPIRLPERRMQIIEKHEPKYHVETKVAAPVYILPKHGPVYSQRRLTPPRLPPIVVKPPHVLVKPTPVFVKPSPVFVRPPPVYVKPPPVVVRPSPVYVRPSPIYMKQGPTFVRPPPVEVKPHSIYVRPSPVVVRPAPTFVKPSPVVVRPEPVYVRPRPVYVRPGPVSVNFRKPVHAVSALPAIQTVQTVGPAPIYAGREELVYTPRPNLPGKTGNNTIFSVALSIDDTAFDNSFDRYLGIHDRNVCGMRIYEKNAPKYKIETKVAAPVYILPKHGPVVAGYNAPDLPYSRCRCGLPFRHPVSGMRVFEKYTPNYVIGTKVASPAYILPKHSPVLALKQCTTPLRRTCPTKIVVSPSPPTPVVVRPGPVVVKPPPVIVRPSTVFVKPPSVFVKPAPVVLKQGPVYVKPTPVTVKPSNVYVKPAPVVVRPSPVFIRPSPVCVKPSTTVVKPLPIIMKSSPVVVKEQTVVERPTLLTSTETCSPSVLRIR